MHNETPQEVRMGEFLNQYTPLIDAESGAYTHDDTQRGRLSALLEQYITAYVTRWEDAPTREMITMTMREQLNTMVDNPILVTKMAHSFAFLAQEIALSWSLRNSDEPYTARRYADMVVSWHTQEASGAPQPITETVTTANAPQDTMEQTTPEIHTPLETPQTTPLMLTPEDLYCPELPHSEQVRAHIEAQWTPIEQAHHLTEPEHGGTATYIRAWIHQYAHRRLTTDPMHDGWQSLTDMRINIRKKLEQTSVKDASAEIADGAERIALHIAHALKKNIPHILAGGSHQTPQWGSSQKPEEFLKGRTLADIEILKKNVMGAARAWYYEKMTGAKETPANGKSFHEIAGKYTKFRNIGRALVQATIPLAGACGVGAATIALGGAPHILSSVAGGGVGYALGKAFDTKKLDGGMHVSALKELKARTAVHMLAEGIGEIPDMSKFDKFVYDKVISKMYASPYKNISYLQIQSSEQVRALLNRYEKDAEQQQKNTKWLLWVASLVGIVGAHVGNWDIQLTDEPSPHFGAPDGSSHGERLREFWSRFFTTNTATPENMCNTSCFKPFGSPHSWPPPVHGGGATAAAGQFGWGR